METVCEGYVLHSTQALYTYIRDVQFSLAKVPCHDIYSRSLLLAAAAAVDDVALIQMMLWLLVHQQ